MQTVVSIINPARSALCTVDSSLSVCEAVAYMCQLGVGCVVVVDREEGIIGVLTERDVLQMIAAEHELIGVSVGQVMPNAVRTISPGASLEEAMEQMTASRHQQLLVADHAEIYGLVSIEEVVQSILDDRDALIGDLTYYITH